MTTWPPRRETLKRPVYRSLAQSLVEAVRSGAVRPGARLPTHRALAYELGLSVQTVSRAYEELSRLGIISGEVGRGSFVRSPSADPRTPWQRLAGGDEVIDCSMLTPVTGEIHAVRLQATLAALAGTLPPEAMFSFRPRATLERHCVTALGWLARAGVDVPVEQVLPTNGSTTAMAVALMAAASPGDLVVAEEMSHHTLKPLAHTLGLRLTGLEIDEEGLLPSAFERACAATAVKVLFLLPEGLGPTAATMGEARRRELVEIARRCDVLLVENDAWGPVQPRRGTPLAALAPERTFYFTGLSKCLLPGLRAGWLVVPERLISTARTRHLVTSWMATPLIAEIASRWLEDGTADELLRWQRRQLAHRNQLAAEALEGLPYRCSPNGLHVWLDLPEQWPEDAFVAHARHEGVAVAAGANFAITEPQRWRGIRICLGAATGRDIAHGLEAIARLARNRPAPALLAI